MLEGLAPLILDSQGRDLMRGILLDDDTPSAKLRLGRYLVQARHDYDWEWASPARLVKPWPRAGALIVSVGPDAYVVAGNGVILTFTPADAADARAGIARVEEGRFDGRRWIPGRRLNGDETHQGRHLRLPAGAFGIQRIELYRYR
jgi:beta-galactosidase GanA